MARSPRIDFPGAVHHVMNRGARRAAIFGEPWVCRLFLQVLSELPERFNVRILAYAILPNHYHLLLECPEGNLSAAMRYLGAEFTQRLNRAMAWDGPVFRGRFRNGVVTTEAYLAHLFAYIHLNPVRAGLASSADAAGWTSHRALVGLDRAPAWLERGRLTAAHGSLEAYGAYLDDLLAERITVPPEWEPKRSWINEPEPAALCAPASPPRKVEQLLADVAEVTDTPVEALVRRPEGRAGHGPRQLAAWWLGRRARLTNTEIGRILGCSPSRVSQMRGLVRDRTGPAARSREALLIPQPPDPLLLAEPGAGEVWLLREPEPAWGYGAA